MKRIVLKSLLICLVLILGFTFNTAHGWLTDIPYVNWGNLNIEPEYIYDPTWWLSDQIWQFREVGYYAQHDSATLAYMPVNPVMPLWLIGLDWVPVAGIPDLFPVMDFQYGMYGPPTFGLTSYGSYPQFPVYGNPYVHIEDSMIKAVFGYDDKYLLVGSGDKVWPLGVEQGYWINLSKQSDLIVNNEQLDAQDYSLNILLNTPGIDINPLSYLEEYTLSDLSFQDVQFHCLNCFSGYDFTCADCIAPSPPLYLNIEPNETCLSLYWKDNSSNELGFIIEVQNLTGDWEEIGRRNANGGEILPWPKFKMFWSHEGLIPNKNYCYRIVAWNDFGRSESLIVCKKTLPIESPCCLRITNVEETSITIQWRDNSLIEDGYKIIRNDNVVAYVNANSETGIISWKDEGLNPDTEYCYKAEAYNQYGSARTNSVCVKTKALNLPPNPPTDLTITSATETSISLKWKDNSNNETQWTLYSRTPPHTGEIKTIYSRGPHDEIAEGPWMTYTHTGLNPGTEYHYIVRANNEAGSSHSNDIIGKTTGHAELIITACLMPQPSIPWSPFCLYYEVKNVGTLPNESGLLDYIFWRDNFTNQVVWSGSVSTPVLQPGESYLVWGCVTSGFPEGCYTSHIFVGAKDKYNWYDYYTSQCCWWQ